jgi:hypothetical protein
MHAIATMRRRRRKEKEEGGRTTYLYSRDGLYNGRLTVSHMTNGTWSSKSNQTTITISVTTTTHDIAVWREILLYLQLLLPPLHLSRTRSLALSLAIAMLAPMPLQRYSPSRRAVAIKNTTRTKGVVCGKPYRC